jgi:hypothetical protein
MDWGDPEFVLSIIAMVMVASVIKAAIYAKHGVPWLGRHERPDRPRGRREQRNVQEVETLRGENARLIERVESYEDRIAVLERIVTDSSYRLGHEIEALREDKGKVQ